MRIFFLSLLSACLLITPSFAEEVTPDANAEMLAFCENQENIGKIRCGCVIEKAAAEGVSDEILRDFFDRSKFLDDMDTYNKLSKIRKKECPHGMGVAKKEIDFDAISKEAREKYAAPANPSNPPASGKPSAGNGFCITKGKPYTAKEMAVYFNSCPGLHQKELPYCKCVASKAWHNMAAYELNAFTSRQTVAYATISNFNCKFNAYKRVLSECDKSYSGKEMTVKEGMDDTFNKMKDWGTIRYK